MGTDTIFRTPGKWCLSPFFPVACSSACVHPALEVAQHSDGFFIDEREKLHHDRGADSSFRIDPEKCVPNPRPCQAARRAAAWICGRIDQKTQSPLVDCAGMQVHIAR